jgi:hypothetical protein
MPACRGANRLTARSRTAWASSARLHIPIYVDVFGFATGAVDVYLTAMGAPEPVPVEAEHRLLTLLYSRASATHL